MIRWDFQVSPNQPVSDLLARSTVFTGTTGKPTGKANGRVQILSSAEVFSSQ
jgi:hypothetical protein